MRYQAPVGSWLQSLGICPIILALIDKGGIRPARFLLIAAFAMVACAQTAPQTDGPREWTRMALLYACDDLGIDQKLWPPAKGFGYDYQAVVKPLPFQSPNFDILRPSESQWLQLATEAFNKHCQDTISEVRSSIRKSIQDGTVRQVKQTRNASPLRLRFEWAVRRYCLREAYKDMSTKEYSPERIRKAVRAILAEAELPDRK